MKEMSGGGQHNYAIDNDRMKAVMKLDTYLLLLVVL